MSDGPCGSEEDDELYEWIEFFYAAWDAYDAEREAETLDVSGDDV